jgi:hypothetical protein
MRGEIHIYLARVVTQALPILAPMLPFIENPHLKNLVHGSKNKLQNYYLIFENIF